MKKMQWGILAPVMVGVLLLLAGAPWEGSNSISLPPSSVLQTYIPDIISNNTFPFLTTSSDDDRFQLYCNGANDALDAILLLNLEQQLQGTNRTWGAMAEIVCQRLGVERRR